MRPQEIVRLPQEKKKTKTTTLDPTIYTSANEEQKLKA